MASAQMIVHAVSGSVKAVTPASISVVSDNSDAPNQFNLGMPANVRLNFDSDLRAGSVDPGKFEKVGDFALVYYIGYGNDRTAVAVKDLGSGPFTKTQGTVVDYDKHSRKLTLKDESGKEVSLILDEHLVVDTDTGVDSGRKFSPHKGDRVRVTYSAGTPATVALLGEML
jgi:hypothetical protein